MHQQHVTSLLGLVASAVLLSACGEETQLPPNADTGENPKLVEPVKSTLPTINIAPAVGWRNGDKPISASGLQVAAYGRGLNHPRWLHVLPNGDVLVAESNKPAGTGKGGIAGWVMGLVKARAGATVASANRITLLRGLKTDGSAEIQTTFLTGLNSPFGMALVGDTFYVANTDAIIKFPYRTGDLQITAPPIKVADLPAGKLNHHWTKSLVASKDGTKLYASVGSNSNIGENGMEKEERRAGVLEIDIATGDARIFASGLRNPNGLTFNPQSNELWAVVNERDELGSDLVPDYMTSIKDGGFYGWPYSYYGKTVDERVKSQRPDLVAKAIKPDYALGAHTASLGLTFYTANKLPSKYNNGAFIGQHGSWNRQPLNGYKVVFVPFADGKPSGPLEDVMTGFVDASGKAKGRPVGVAVDTAGALLVADDVGNVIWRVTPSNVAATSLDNATAPVQSPR